MSNVWNLRRASKFFQIDRGKIASAARNWTYSAPEQTWRPLPLLRYKSFFYGVYHVRSKHKQILPMVCLQPVALQHRESTTRELKGRGVTSSLKLNLTDPCRIVPCRYHYWGMPGQRAGSPFAVLYMREYNTESPKQGRKRFNSTVLWRQLTFPIFLLFIYDNKERSDFVTSEHSVCADSELPATPPPFSYTRSIGKVKGTQVARHQHRQL